MSRLQRVGAHRSSSARRMPRWAILLLALGVAVVLAAAALFLLELLRPQAQAPEPVATTAPEVIADPAQIDPALDASITVLDASGQVGFAAGVGQALHDAGWTVTATGAATEAAADTIVWYDGEQLAPVARGIAQVLGGGQALASDGRLSGSPITIVVGSSAVGVAPSVEPHEDSEVEHSPTPTDG